MCWKDHVAELVREEVRLANGGKWPVSKEEWERLAWRFGFRVCFYSDMHPEEAFILRRVIHMPEPCDRVPIHHPVFRHELAEAALVWEGREPYACPPEPPRDARHDVALRVEKL